MIWKAEFVLKTHQNILLILFLDAIIQKIPEWYANRFLSFIFFEAIFPIYSWMA